MKSQQFSLQGINAYSNPLDSKGAFLRAINVDSYPDGGVKKRPGYTTFLGTADGQSVDNIFQWTKDDGSQSYLYAKRGTILSYYDVTAGTGDWAVCGNGTFSADAFVGHAVLENTLILGDGVGSTRHTTNGTSFTNTTLAPLAAHFEQYQSRIYAGGTANTLFYSTIDDPTNWSGAGTSSSASFPIPGEGQIVKVTKIADKLNIHKRGGNTFRYDGYLLEDMATNTAMSSSQSFAKTEDFGFWLNREGVYGSGGDRAELISNAIQPWIYNDFGTGITGSRFQSAAGACFRFDYYLSVGDIADDITGEEIGNAVIKYNYQKNSFFIYSFANRPQAFGVYEDNSGVEHLLFGDSDGQIYKFGGTATSDNGTPIESICEMVVTGGQAAEWKRFREYSSFFNPGSKAKIQMGISDTFRRDGIKLTDLGDTTDGAIHVRFPQGSRGKLLYIKVYENSTGPRWQWYGHALDFDIEDPDG